MTDEIMSNRLAVLLPPMYRKGYEGIGPVSMGSAGLRFDPQGRVAWEQMWASFCNLAMAGGPPHKGRLLEPASPGEVEAEPERYAEVVAEIVRGIALAAGLAARPSSPGWVRLECANDTMAAWMLRAIVMENVSARAAGSLLELPAGPAFRLEKEIKNVITVATKTAHYWHQHMPRREQFAVAQLLARMDAEQALLTPTHATKTDIHGLHSLVAEAVRHATGLLPGGPSYDGWLGFECGSVDEAVALMRLTAVSNVLVRREDALLYLPLNPALDPRGELAAEAVRKAQGYRTRQREAALHRRNVDIDCEAPAA